MIIGTCGTCYVQNVLRKIEQPQYLGVGGSGKLVDFQSAITEKNGLRILGCLQLITRFGKFRMTKMISISLQCDTICILALYYFKYMDCLN